MDSVGSSVGGVHPRRRWYARGLGHCPGTGGREPELSRALGVYVFGDFRAWVLWTFGISPCFRFGGFGAVWGSLRALGGEGFWANDLANVKPTVLCVPAGTLRFQTLSFDSFPPAYQRAMGPWATPSQIVSSRSPNTFSSKHCLALLVLFTFWAQRGCTNSISIQARPKFETCFACLSRA